MQHLGTDAQLPEAYELANAVIDIDNEIADLQIAKIGEKRLREVAALLQRGAFFLEDVGLGVDLKRRVSQAEAAR